MSVPFLSTIYNYEVPIEKKIAPGDYELNLKLCRSNVVSIKYHNDLLNKTGINISYREFKYIVFC